jgi:hypothetical protein
MLQAFHAFYNGRPCRASANGASQMLVDFPATSKRDRLARLHPKRGLAVFDYDDHATPIAMGRFTIDLLSSGAARITLR